MAIEEVEPISPTATRPNTVIIDSQGTARRNAVQQSKRDWSLSSVTEVIEADVNDCQPWGHGPGCSISITGLIQANEIAVSQSTMRYLSKSYDKGHSLSLSEVTEGSNMATIRAEKSKHARACGDEETKSSPPNTITLPHIKNTNQNGFIKPKYDESRRHNKASPFVIESTPLPRSENSDQRTPPIKSKRTRQLLNSEHTDSSSLFTISDSRSLKNRIRPIDCSSLSIRRNGGILHLSPRMQALQSFFDDNRSVVENWKNSLFRIAKDRSPSDLQWAEQKLRTFSANNKMNPAAAPAGKYFHMAPDNVGDSTGRPVNNYIPYSGLFTRESDKNISMKHKEYKSERHGSTLDPLISDKITPEAQEILLVLRDTVATVIDDIIIIDQEIPKRNFAPCVAIVEHLQMLPNMLIALIDHLHYTPQEFELVSVAKNITELIEDVSSDPVIVLFRMIELGHYLYYLGRILGEKIVPKDLPRLLHSIQVKLQVNWARLLD